MLLLLLAKIKNSQFESGSSRLTALNPDSPLESPEKEKKRERDYSLGPTPDQLSQELQATMYHRTPPKVTDEPSRVGQTRAGTWLLEADHMGSNPALAGA